MGARAQMSKRVAFARATPGAYFCENPCNARGQKIGMQ